MVVDPTSQPVLQNRWWPPKPPPISLISHLPSREISAYQSFQLVPRKWLCLSVLSELKMGDQWRFQLGLCFSLCRCSIRLANGRVGQHLEGFHRLASSFQCHLQCWQPYWLMKPSLNHLGKCFPFVWNTLCIRSQLSSIHQCSVSNVQLHHCGAWQHQSMKLLQL